MNRRWPTRALVVTGSILSASQRPMMLGPVVFFCVLVLTWSACGSGSTPADGGEKLAGEPLQQDQPVKVEFLRGSRTSSETRVAVRITMPAGVTFAAAPRLLQHGALGFPHRTAPTETDRDGSEYTFIYPSTPDARGSDVALEFGPFIKVGAARRSLVVDVAHWLDRNAVAASGDEADVLPSEILSAGPGLAAVRSVRVTRALASGELEVSFRFDVDVGHYWLIESDTGLGASLVGAHESEDSARSPSWNLSIPGVSDFERLRGVFTLTKIEEPDVIQEGVHRPEDRSWWRQVRRLR